MRLSPRFYNLLIAFILLALFPITVLAEPVQLADATVLKVRLLHALTSGEVKVGQLVEYSVIDDVTGPNGVVLIHKGARATGKVTESQRRGMFGKSGKLEFTIEAVTATDGTQVPLRATQNAKGDSNTTAVVATVLLVSVLGVFVNGRDVTVKEGTEFLAYTDGNSFIDPAKALPPAGAPAGWQPPTAQTQLAPPAPSNYMVDPVDIDKLAAGIKMSIANNATARALLAKGKIGITNFKVAGNNQAVVDFIGENLTMTMIKNNMQVVDRSQLDNVLRQNNITDMSTVSSEMIQRVGAQAGCNLLVLGNVIDLGPSLTIFFRVYDVSTGQAIAADRLDGVRKVMAF